MASSPASESIALPEPQTRPAVIMPKDKREFYATVVRIAKQRRKTWMAVATHPRCGIPAEKNVSAAHIRQMRAEAWLQVRKNGRELRANLRALAALVRP